MHGPVLAVFCDVCVTPRTSGLEVRVLTDAAVRSRKKRRIAVVLKKRDQGKNAICRRCMPQYLVKHIMSSMRSLFELEQGTRATTKEHASQNSRNGIDLGPDDVLEAGIDHVPGGVVDGEPAEWLGIELEVGFQVVERRVLLDLAGLGDERDVELR
jgi:hypothetical protein